MKLKCVYACMMQCIDTIMHGYKWMHSGFLVNPDYNVFNVSLKKSTRLEGGGDIIF